MLFVRAAEAAAGAKVSAISLQRIDQSDNAFASVTDVPWDGRQRVRASSGELLNTESFDGFFFNTRFFEPYPLDLSLPSEWTPPWPDLGTANQAFSDSTVEQFHQIGFFSPDYSEKEFPSLSVESTSPTYFTQPGSPTSPPSIASVCALDRRIRDSISSRGSRSSRSCTSGSMKRRIEPLKHSKTMPREPSESFSCDLCERRFRYKKDVDRHKSSVHNKRPSWFCPTPECKFATQGFSRKDKAFQHVKTHRGSLDASLRPVNTTKKSSLRSIGSTPISPPRDPGENILHRDAADLGRTRELDDGTSSEGTIAYADLYGAGRETTPRQSWEGCQEYVNIDWILEP